MVRQLGQGVLQHRQCAGLVGDVAQNGRDEARLDLEPDATCRLGDHLGEAGLAGNCHRRHRRLEQLAEARIAQRSIEEVGPERHDDTHSVTVVARDGRQAGEERLAHGLVGSESEQLFELIDDQQQVGVVIRQDVLGGSQQPAVVGAELGEQPGRAADRDAHQGGLQLLERIDPREHLGDHQVALHAESMATTRGHQAGLDQTRLPRT